MTETLSRRHRENPEEEEDKTNLVHGEKRRKPGTHRRRSATMEEGDGPTQGGEEPASSSNVPPKPSTGERNTRFNLIPREEHLTAEDWAIMEAVEKFIVWRSLKALNLRQREKLLAAICIVFQETVEGNPGRSTVNTPDDFRDWGRRWGTDEDAAQSVMQNQWDNMLHHIMGITEAMEVWNPSVSSSSAAGEIHGTGEIIQMPQTWKKTWGITTSLPNVVEKLTQGITTSLLNVVEKLTLRDATTRSSKEDEC